MRHSESIAKLAAAVVKANAEVANALKDSTNPHYGSTFASLNSVLDAIKPVYAGHGLTVVQLPGLEDGDATLDTMLLHESGEWLAHTSGAPLQKDDPQGVGSAITYLRRYSMAALAGIGQHDDDGNAASSEKSVSKPAKPKPKSDDDMIACPECGAEMWDNRGDAKSSINGGKRPDLKCKDDGDHAIWLGSWRDKLKSNLADAHTSGAIDAEERSKGEEAADSLSPKRMLSLEGWLDTQVSKAILGGVKEATPA